MPVAGDVQDLIGSFLSSTPVSGHTHNFYRYPARFSPQFARAAIEEFTEPGDTVLDPFLGGGTTAVETLVAGRRFVGCDINPLATFLARTKTTGLGLSDAEHLIRWSESLQHSINLRTSNSRHADWTAYQRNLPWWLRKTLELALDSLRSLRTSRQRRFARCTLLKTSQWALDCRLNLPTTADFLDTHGKNVREMLEAALGFSWKASRALGCFPSRVSRYRRILTRMEIPLNDIDTVLVETDADAEFDRRGLVAIRTEPDRLEQAGKAPLRGGRIRWRLKPRDIAKVGDAGKIVVTLTKPDGAQLSDTTEFVVLAPVEEKAKPAKDQVPPFDIKAINPEDHPEEWGVAWPDLSGDDVTIEQQASVAYKPVRVGGGITVYYSTIFFCVQRPGGKA